MHDIKAYFVTINQAVQTYMSECTARLDAFYEQAEMFEAEFPDYTGAYWVHAGNRSLVGLFGPTPPGPEWLEVNTKSRSYWRPRRSLKAGKVLAARMDSLKCSHPPVPGLPRSCHTDRCNYWPGLIQTGPQVWATCGCAPETVENSDLFDSSIWFRGKASQYWLAREHSESNPVEA